MCGIVRKPLSRIAMAALAAVVVAAAGGRAEGSPEADAALAVYSGKIRPLLAKACFSCHGSLKQEAGLRLDTVDLLALGGDSGPAIVRGDAAASLIVERVADQDPDSRMPPEGEGEPLTTEQVEMLRTWIAAGAPAPAGEEPEADPRSHWAFQPRTRPAVPTAANVSWVRNPIDAFLSSAHERAGLVPQPEPARHVLVRRLYLDLIGLPPAPDELAAIVGDRSADWYEKLVDRLLADPRHGERWARHWMDVWRYSDWWGLGEEHRNSQKHMWHYRDWIVESLNADVPYDEMVRQMLAADELYPEDPAKLRATGYLARNWYAFNRTQWLDETVEHVGKGLLGVTMNCAKCHAHKYDPIEQVDYYRMRAFPRAARRGGRRGRPEARRHPAGIRRPARRADVSVRARRGVEARSDARHRAGRARPAGVSRAGDRAGVAAPGGSRAASAALGDRGPSRVDGPRAHQGRRGPGRCHRGAGREGGRRRGGRCGG
jgi:mono/diheme cytochrome c family protein